MCVCMCAIYMWCVMCGACMCVQCVSAKKRKCDYLLPHLK